MTFSHSWEGAPECSKCKQCIPKNAHYWENDPTVLLCEGCLLMLEGDIDKCVRIFLGKYEEPAPYITNDECLKYLVKYDSRP
jgi:hypothetical protein